LIELNKKTVLKELNWHHSQYIWEGKEFINSYVELNEPLMVSIGTNENNVISITIYNSISKPTSYYDELFKLSKEDKIKKLSEGDISLKSNNPIYSELLMSLYQSISNDRLKLVKATDTNVALIKVLKQWRINGRENILV